VGAEIRVYLLANMMDYMFTLWPRVYIQKFSFWIYPRKLLFLNDLRKGRTASFLPRRCVKTGSEMEIPCKKSLLKG
jgi:hypothetical protein